MLASAFRVLAVLAGLAAVDATMATIGFANHCGAGAALRFRLGKNASDDEQILMTMGVLRRIYEHTTSG